MAREEKLDAGTSIRVNSGKYVDVFNPDPETILIKDIAHALSNQVRWGGHANVKLSVAEHCINCARYILKENSRAYKEAYNALMHDASEAYLLDIPRPIKLALPQYLDIEEGLMIVISQKFGFEWPMNEKIAFVDDHFLRKEWIEIILSGKKNIEVMTSREARNTFLDLFDYLTTKIKNEEKY